MNSFSGGIHPPETKNTSSVRIEEIPLPKKVVIPLSQHTGAPSKPVVKAGDIVKTGQLIADVAGFISAKIHSPVSGKILSIEPCLHPSGYNVESIIIESDGKDEKVEFIPNDPDKLFPDEMVELIKNAGIVGLGGAAFPTHVKLSPPQGKTINSVILNGCECEPYLTCDYRVMLEETKEILGGLKLIIKILNIEHGYIGIEDNKRDAIKAFNVSSAEDPAFKEKLKIVKLKTKYPQGAEKQLIKAILKKNVPSGKLPMDVGCIVQNVQTAKVIYDAVYKGKPLYERVITVAGSVRRPGNLRVRFGTPLAEVIDYCGGLIGNVRKVIAGGPMMGISQFSLDVPVVKGTSGVVILTEEESKYYEPSNCIKCGRCIDVCPMGLVPAFISRFAEKRSIVSVEDLKNFNPLDCMECGSCAYECPAKIHLVQNIKLAKMIVQNRKI
ncbi:MAG: electron transport complex subunit RsxC [Elusimicrobia bacterium]|nr:electron transport complex subunit RsxC [Elusimicrobiota bacterium]